LAYVSPFFTQFNPFKTLMVNPGQPENSNKQIQPEDVDALAVAFAKSNLFPRSLGVLANAGGLGGGGRCVVALRPQ
jgi:hypothetical protein